MCQDVTANSSKKYKSEDYKDNLKTTQEITGENVAGSAGRQTRRDGNGPGPHACSQRGHLL